MSLQSFFYDQQIRRYIIQFIRMVSNFQVEFGRDRNSVIALQRVPVIYGDSSRQVASIIQQNSENVLNAVPAMAVYVSGLTYDRERLQNPTYVGKLNLRERYFDPATGQMSTTQGDVFTVERLMPVPYKLTLNLDIWTSNTEQKLQLLEQLTILFNPALEIQSTDNYIDWTSITYVLLTNVNWSSRTVPIGTDTPIDVATLTFELPIFISAPALVKKLGVVQKIIASVFDGSGGINEAIYDDEKLLSQQYFTPLTYGVILFDNELRLVKYDQHVTEDFGVQVVKELLAPVTANTNVILSDTDGISNNMVISGLSITSNASPTITTVPNCIVIGINGDTVTASNLITGNIGDRIVFTATTRKEGPSEPWRDLINVYGNLVNGTSTIRLELDDGNEVIGTVAYNPVDDTALLWTPDIDTIPVNTLEPVNAIIDPQSARPNKNLQDLATGTRYLLVNDYVSAPGAQPAYNWYGIDNTLLEAYANDIIEFNGQHWAVVFDSRYETQTEYVTNLTTGTQYKWNGSNWSKSYEGFYPAGKWQLTI
jgi:hypothetical protein